MKIEKRSYVCIEFRDQRGAILKARVLSLPPNYESEAIRGAAARLIEGDRTITELTQVSAWTEIAYAVVEG